MGICPVKCQLDQIQNGRLSATITFNMPDLWQTVPDSLTIIIKQNMRFQVGMCPVKFHLDQIQNGRLSIMIKFNIPDIWKTVSAG